MSNNLVARKVTTPDLMKMTVEQLEAELVSCLEFHAETAYRMAAIWMELERRGCDLSRFKTGFRQWLYPIATGKLLAEAAVAFMHRPHAVDALIGLSLELQRKIINGYKLKVYNPGQGKPSSMTLEEMPNHLIKLVFQFGKIVGPDKQKALLRYSPPRRSVSAAKRLLRTRILVSPDKRTVTVGQTKVDTTALVNTLADAGGFGQEVIESKERRARVVATKVTDEEYDRLEALAKGSNTTMDAMVRKALIALYLV